MSELNQFDYMEINKLARNGSAEDLADLLNKHGQDDEAVDIIGWAVNKGGLMDWISGGSRVGSPYAEFIYVEGHEVREQARKKATLKDFHAGEGRFAPAPKEDSVSAEFNASTLKRIEDLEKKAGQLLAAQPAKASKAKMSR